MSWDCALRHLNDTGMKCFLTLESSFISTYQPTKKAPFLLLYCDLCYTAYCSDEKTTHHSHLNALTVPRILGGLGHRGLYLSAGLSEQAEMTCAVDLAWSSKGLRRISGWFPFWRGWQNCRLVWIYATAGYMGINQASDPSRAIQQGPPQKKLQVNVFRKATSLLQYIFHTFFILYYSISKRFW